MSKLDDYVKDKPELQAEEWLWKKQAAEALGVSEKTLERAAAKGTIAQKEKNRKTFYSIKDLKTFEQSQNSDVFKAIPTTEEPKNMQTDITLVKSLSSLQLPTAPSFTPGNQDLQQRLVFATVEKAEAEAKKAYYEGNLTFPLNEVAEMFNLSIVDIKQNAKTFKGKNQKLMITKANLEKYLESL
jgi:hypothetical protein